MNRRKSRSCARRRDGSGERKGIRAILKSIKGSGKKMNTQFNPDYITRKKSLKNRVMGGLASLLDVGSDRKKSRGRVRKSRGKSLPRGGRGRGARGRSTRWDEEEEEEDKELEEAIAASISSSISSSVSSSSAELATIENFLNEIKVATKKTVEDDKVANLNYDVTETLDKFTDEQLSKSLSIRHINDNVINLLKPNHKAFIIIMIDVIRYHKKPSIINAEAMQKIFHDLKKEDLDMVVSNYVEALKTFGIITTFEDLAKSKDYIFYDTYSQELLKQMSPENVTTALKTRDLDDSLLDLVENKKKFLEYFDEQRKNKHFYPSLKTDTEIDNMFLYDTKSLLNLRYFKTSEDINQNKATLKIIEPKLKLAGEKLGIFSSRDARDKDEGEQRERESKQRAAATKIGAVFKGFSVRKNKTKKNDDINLAAFGFNQEE